MDAPPATFEPCYDLAIIGGGFSGSLTAIHLAAAGGGRDIALIEKEPSAFGRGVAYNTPCQRHLLNVPAGKMGAFPDRVDDFLRWVEAHPQELAALGLDRAEAGSFLPRVLYGKYVASLLDEATAHSGGRLRRIAGEAVDLEQLPDGLRVSFADGRRLRAARVVLALGVFPPGDPPLRDSRYHRSPRYLYSPWSAETHERLARGGDALILGSGLTGLDLLVTLNARKAVGVLHVISRRGLFPRPHRAGLPAYPAFLRAGALPRSCRAILRALRAELARAERAGADWRAVVDSIRPFTQEFWQGLDHRERRRFLRHLRAWWEPHRHRVAPEVLALKEQMERDGRLVCHCGRIERVAEADGGSALDVMFRPAGTQRRETLRLDYVVNCTGPECNYHRLGDPLVTELFGRGLARPDALLLGLDVAEGGAVRDVHGATSGRLYTLGSPQKGRLMETTAVPELRAQARELAALLLAPPPGPQSPEPPQPARVPRHDVHLVEHAYAFDI